MEFKIAVCGIEEETRAVRLLQGLIEAQKLREFSGAMDSSTTPWDAICMFEEDLLRFQRKNRWCGVLDEGWAIEVGRCPLLPQVPSYTEWGKVAAWIRVDEFVLVIDPPSRCIEVWYDMDFYDNYEATIRCTAPFAEDSAILMNKILKAY
jgi:hypothetical protein